MVITHSFPYPPPPTLDMNLLYVSIDLSIWALHISGIIWHKSFALFCTWRLSLCMFSIVTHDTEYIYFLAFYHQIICHCMDITDIINLFFSWTVFGLFLLFYLLWIKFATNIYARIFLWTYVFISLGYITKRRIAGLYGNSTLNLLRNCQTVCK